MKILHCSDIHLGRRPPGGQGEYSQKRYDDYFTAFGRAIDIAIELDVDVLIIAGDFFDRKELLPEVLERSESLLIRLKDKGIEVLAIDGNHDAITRGKESESWLCYLENKGYLRIPNYRLTENGFEFNPITIGGVKFYGLGYPGSFVDEVLTGLATWLESHNDETNIIIVHTAIADDKFMAGTATRQAVDTLSGKAIYIAGGHFHYHSVYPAANPYFFLPGSLEYWEFGEVGQAKGMILFDTDTRKYQFIPSQPRKATLLRFQPAALDFEGFKTEFINAAKDLEVAQSEEIIVVELKIDGSYYIDLGWCEQILEQAGALKSFIKLAYPAKGIDTSTLSLDMGKEQIEYEIISTWRYFSKQAQLTHTTLERLKAYQENGNEQQFLESLDHLLETIIDPKGSVILNEVKNLSNINN